MKVARVLGAALLGTMISLGAVGQGFAWPTVTHIGATGNDMVVNVRAEGGRGAKAGRGNVNRTSVNRTSVNHTSVNHTSVNRTNVNVNRRTNVNVNRGTNVNVNVARGPVRVWAPRPYYGTVVGGVALGTMIAVSAMGAAPAVPAPNMCWFWADAAQMSGYWDYCQAPF
jgi:hypothetical protein